MRCLSLVVAALLLGASADPDLDTAEWLSKSLGNAGSPHRLLKIAR